MGEGGGQSSLQRQHPKALKAAKEHAAAKEHPASSVRRLRLLEERVRSDLLAREWRWGCGLPTRDALRSPSMCVCTINAC